MDKLIIIENSNFIINVLTDMFSDKNNFKIYSAKCLSEAKTLLQKHDFFAAITSTVLPDALNGEIIELLEKYDLPTIVLTSAIDNKFIDKMNNLNIVEYIFKENSYGLKNVNRIVELIKFMKYSEVLIVDDSKTSINQIKKILQPLQLEIYAASNGQEALEKLKIHTNISLIISDYNMPIMDGLEFLKIIRKDKIIGHTPVIMLSSNHDNYLRTKLYKSGANDFLTKPILEEELKIKVINILDNIKQMQEIHRFNDMFDDNIISSSTDTKGIIKSVSTAFCEISGYSKEELVGKNHNIVRHPDMPSSTYKSIWENLSAGKSWRGEIKNLKKDGNAYWVNVVIEPTFDKNNKIIGYFAIRQDITDKKRIFELSITDGLTSLFNRRYFNDISQSLIDIAKRDNKFFAFMILDIDNFKKYNDNYGHQNGDEVLIEVSKTLKECFKRSEDVVFRLGGEEFGVLIKATKESDIINLANKAREDIENLQIEHIKNIPNKVVTSSFGLAIISDEKHKQYNFEIDDIYKKADIALYKAKENGRNRVEIINI